MVLIMNTMRSTEAGFTLIELLTVIGLLGVLTSLTLQGFILYKASAGYSVAEGTLRNARTALTAAETDTQTALPDIALQTQSTPGAIVNPDGKKLLPALQIPKNLTLRYEHNSSCTDIGCIETLIRANHCSAKTYIQWVRFGDGTEFPMENVAGAGCA